MRPIVNGIQKLLKQKLNIYTIALTPQTNLKKDLNLVDWEMLYLLNAIEQNWHISITQNDSDRIVIMEHLMAIVKKKVTETANRHY